MFKRMNKVNVLTSLKEKGLLSVGMDTHALTLVRKLVYSNLE